LSFFQLSEFSDCSEVTIYISILQEELAHEMMKKGLELAKPVAIVMKG